MCRGRSTRTGVGRGPPVRAAGWGRGRASPPVQAAVAAWDTARPCRRLGGASGQAVGHGPGARGLLVRVPDIGAGSAGRGGLAAGGRWAVRQLGTGVGRGPPVQAAMGLAGSAVPGARHLGRSRRLYRPCGRGPLVGWGRGRVRSAGSSGRVGPGKPGSRGGCPGVRAWSVGRGTGPPVQAAGGPWRSVRVPPAWAAVGSGARSPVWVAEWPRGTPPVRAAGGHVPARVRRGSGTGFALGRGGRGSRRSSRGPPGPPGRRAARAPPGP